MATILDFGVKMASKRQTVVRIGFPVVDLVQKVIIDDSSLFCSVIFKDGVHVCPPHKNAGIFARGQGAKYFLKGSEKPNQSSNCQRMVTESMF